MTYRRTVLSLVLSLASLAACAGVWPATSLRPAPPLQHPTLQERMESLEYQLEAGFRFVAFGDQRALADGEWQSMMRVIGGLDTHQDAPPLLFMLDTGDIVQDGSHSDQFEVLGQILSPAADLPYLIGVGNHEVHNNQPGSSRRNLVRFLSTTGLPIQEDRLYYSLDIGPMRLIAMDTSDLVYGWPAGQLDPFLPRLENQLVWLREQLAEGPNRPPLTVVAMHHPILHSSKKHRGAARNLWSYTHQGDRIVDILADGGTDLILTGHTHTYERFTLTRSDGKQMSLVNLSGRPRNSFWWFGAGQRRATDLSAEDETWFADRGWDLGDWTVVQDDVLGEPERNQFGLFTIGPWGEVGFELWLVDEDGVVTSPPSITPLKP